MSLSQQVKDATKNVGTVTVTDSTRGYTINMNGHMRVRAKWNDFVEDFKTNALGI